MDHLTTRPSLTRGFMAVWRRNLRVWRKLMVPSLMGNFGEPVIFLLGLGYGLGRLVGEVDGMSYMVFLASGIVCSSALTAATFEGLYSAYTRLTQQLTWSAMLATPLTVDEIVFGEISWAATKAVINSAAILAVAAGLGLVTDARAVLVLPAILAAGMAFGGLAMIVTTVARSYDFFLYYFTLFMTPMMLLSGVFFPLDELPEVVARAAHGLPLAHVVALVRPLMTGSWPTAPLINLAVIAAYAGVSYWLAAAVARRRLRQ
jgi:lipooligosaccharide transport system permease protein